MKLYIIAILLLLPFASATLVDQYDFEGLTAGVNITSQDSDFDCFGLYTEQECTRTVGAPVTASAGNTIVSESGNEYLRMFAFNKEAGNNYKQAGIQWDLTNGTDIGTIGEAWYTITFRMKYGIYQDDKCNGTDNGVCNGGLDTAKGSWDNALIGGDADCGEGNCQLRLGLYTPGATSPPYAFNIGTEPAPEPASTSCYVNNTWSAFSINYYLNFTGTYDMDRIIVYQDGVKCYEFNISLIDTYPSGSPFWSELYFFAGGGYSIDIDDIKVYENETVIATLAECADGTDNDGDALIDLLDPSCTDASDDSELPVDVTECNDGIDNDLDGFTDYPEDPSCDSATDTTETPADATSQPDTECLEAEDCIFADDFPYTDSIERHGWEGNLGSSSVQTIFGGQRFVLSNLGVNVINISANKTNDADYRYVTAEFTLYTDDITPSYLNAQHYHTIFYDQQDREIIKLRHQTRHTGVDGNIQIWTEQYNGTGYEQIYSQLVSEGDGVRYKFTLDQVLKTFNATFTSDGTQSPTQDIDWTNTLANKYHRFNIDDGNLSTTVTSIAIDDILVEGSQAQGTTTCDTWSLPFYLKESFNGYIDLCDWAVSHQIFADGDLEVTDDISYYYAQKTNDLALDTNTRYVTTMFDLNVKNINVSGSTITLRWYDEDATNYMTLYFRDTGDYLWYNNEGTGSQITQITLNESYPYKIVFDFIDDTADVYYNNSLVGDDIATAIAFFNVESQQTFKITSSDANFIIDNVQIFGSDSNGTSLLPDDVIEEPLEEEYAFCNLFWEEPTTCSTNDDCPTGVCLPNKKCSGFDYTYCDENNKERNNYCIMGAMTNCFLSGTGDLILDNFFLFLILLLLLIGLVYLAMIFRRSGDT